MRRRDDEYEAAMERCLAIEPSNFEWVDGRKPTRDELHAKSTVVNSNAHLNRRDIRARKTP